MEMLTSIGTVVGIVAVMLLRDWRDGRSVFKKAKDNVPEWAQELQTHYNHDTSEKLELIIDKLDKMLVDGVRIRKN